MKDNHYGRLGLMTALSFVAMYILMYAMVAGFHDVFMNVNQIYMAGLMAAGFRWQRWQGTSIHAMRSRHPPARSCPSRLRG